MSDRYPGTLHDHLLLLRLELLVLFDHFEFQDIVLLLEPTQLDLHLSVSRQRDGHKYDITTI